MENQINRRGEKETEASAQTDADGRRRTQAAQTDTGCTDGGGRTQAA